MIDLRKVPTKQLAYELLARAGRFKMRHVLKALDKGQTASAYTAFGEEMLDLFMKFSESRGWLHAPDDVAAIVPRIRSGDNQEGEFIARLLNILMPAYDRDLYRYYVLQQYHSFYRFLQYPFLGALLDMYILPYREAAKRMGPLGVLEYGPGIPYGLLSLLRESPDAVNHVTLVDLDLVYLDFAEFLVKHYARPGTGLTVCRLRTIDETPSLKPEHNLVFAKDVFEHLKEPEKVLQSILTGIGPHAVCFFDFRDHGAKKFQHVTPNVAYLKRIVQQQGLRYDGELQQLDMFSKGTPEE